MHNAARHAGDQAGAGRGLATAEIDRLIAAVRARHRAGRQHLSARRLQARERRRLLHPLRRIRGVLGAAPALNRGPRGARRRRWSCRRRSRAESGSVSALIRLAAVRRPRRHHRRRGTATPETAALARAASPERLGACGTRRSARRSDAPPHVRRLRRGGVGADRGRPADPTRTAVAARRTIGTREPSGATFRFGALLRLRCCCCARRSIGAALPPAPPRPRRRRLRREACCSSPIAPCAAVAAARSRRSLLLLLLLLRARSAAVLLLLLLRASALAPPLLALALRSLALRWPVRLGTLPSR